MSPFLLNQIWIGIGDFLLNFFATFGSVLGLQVTVLIRVSQIHGDCLFCFLSLDSDQRNKSALFTIMSSNLQN